MDRSKHELSSEAITQEAASWFLKIQDGFSQSDFREWRRWIAADDANAAAFDAVREFWQRSDQVDDLPWPGNDELKADTYDGQRVLPLPAKSQQRARGSGNNGRVWLAAASIVAACLIGLGLMRDADQGFDSYETATAEHRLIYLEDGSSVTLGAESDVRIAYDRRERRIELRSGEAYFKVAKDADRPFTVAAGNHTVRAIGTEFDVNIGVRDIKVAVIEGKVRVDGLPAATAKSGSASGLGAAVNLESGDVLDFNVTGGIGIVSQVDPMLSTSWLAGRLAYDGASFESVVADVNRYSDVELIIGDDFTNQRIFTGTIFSDSIDEWLDGIEHAFPVRVVRLEGHGILLIHDER